MKMVEPLDTAVDGKPPRPEQAVPQKPTDLGYVAVENEAPKTEKAPEASSTGFGTLSEQRDSLSKPLPSSAMSSPVSPARRFNTAPRSSSGRPQTPPHVMRQSPHTESGKAHERPLPHQASGASVVEASHHETQPAASAQKIAHVSQTPSPHRPEAMRRQPSSPTSLPGTVSKSYALHQGQQIRFQQQAGTWVAQVQDTWGRTQQLPVLCAPHTTSERAIEGLSTKAPGQHKYCVHILETDQPPWAPRVVYVGAMGLRGGGNSSSSSSECKYPYNVWAKYNSDDEDDGTVRSCGEYFYRDSNNDWQPYGGLYLRADTRALSLSANDIRASSFSVHRCNVNWGDCLTLDTPESTIRRRREERREERRKKQEAQRKKQEEAKQQKELEAKKRQLMELLEKEIQREEFNQLGVLLNKATQLQEFSVADQQRGELTAAVKMLEKFIKELDEKYLTEKYLQELERIEEKSLKGFAEKIVEKHMEELAVKAKPLEKLVEEQTAALLDIEKKSKEYLANEALPTLNALLRERLGDMYQEIPLQTFYDAVKEAMTQGTSAMQMPDPIEDLPATEEYVNEFLAGMKDAFNNPDPRIPLPSFLKKAFAEIDVEKLRPYARALVSQVERAHAIAAKEAEEIAASKARMEAFEAANKAEVARDLQRIRAGTEALLRKNEEVSRREHQRRAEEEAAAIQIREAHYQATKNIAVPSSQLFFVSQTRVGSLKRLQRYLQELQEDLRELPQDEPLPSNIQEDITYIWQQSNKDQAALTPIYRQLKKQRTSCAADLFSNEHARGDLALAITANKAKMEAFKAAHKAENEKARGDYLALQENSLANEARLEALHKEANMIKERENDAILAQDLLEAYDTMRQTLSNIVAQHQAQLHADTLLDLTEYEPDWQNDYSQAELMAYIAKCSLVPQHDRAQMFVTTLRLNVATELDNIQTHLLHPMAFEKQSLMERLQNAPQIKQHIASYYPQIAAKPKQSEAFAQVHGLVMYAILTHSNQHQTMKVQQLNELKKRIYWLSKAVEHVITQPTKLLGS